MGNAGYEDVLGSHYIWVEIHSLAMREAGVSVPEWGE